MVPDGHESEWTLVRDEIDAIEKVFTTLNQGETTVNPKSWTAIEKRRGLSQFIIMVIVKLMWLCLRFEH